MASKTNAVRLVEQAKIPCREAEYAFDENDLNGLHAAEGIGMPPEPLAVLVDAEYADLCI